MLSKYKELSTKNKKRLLRFLYFHQTLSIFNIIRYMYNHLSNNEGNKEHRMKVDGNQKDCQKTITE